MRVELLEMQIMFLMFLIGLIIVERSDWVRNSKVMPFIVGFLAAIAGAVIVFCIKQVRG